MIGTSSPPSLESGALAPRRRDRRAGIGDLLIAVSRAIGDRTDVSSVRGAFEQALRRLLPVRSIQLRDGGAKRANHPEVREAAAKSLMLEVAGATPGPHGFLEATVDPASNLGEWDLQVLDFACHAAALVLEIERSRIALLRAGVPGGFRPRRDGAAPLLGSTPIMQALRGQIERVASTDFTVLIEGESGVGKELVARQIHDLSRRRNGPFVAVNCAALVETLLEAELFGIEERTATGVRGRRGKFEHADGGTLFLDEVSDLSLSAQAKLLRVIQDLAVEPVGGSAARRVDIRIVAATNRGLSGLVERQLFRQDLFYRLSGVDLRVPALRERRADILELARYFLERHRNARRLGLSGAAARFLVAHDWPGNVRELERLMERAVALAESDVIEIDDLPPTVRGFDAAALLPALERNETLRACGSRYARLIVERCKGNKREACRVLDISYHTLAAYLKYQLPEVVAATSDAWRAGQEGETPVEAKL